MRPLDTPSPGERLRAGTGRWPAAVSTAHHGAGAWGVCHQVED